MAKKGFLVVFLMILAAGAGFSQGSAAKPHKHEAFDLLVGVGTGFDFGIEKVDITSMWDWIDPVSTFDMYYNANFNVNFDFYVFPWLSISTGFIFGPSIFVYKRFPFMYDELKEGKDIGMYMTIPLSLHINIPNVEWLYVGVGVGFNIPVASFAPNDDVQPRVNPQYEARYFTSLPIDIGVDYAKKKNRAGGRFLIRITPQFHPYYFDYIERDEGSDETIAAENKIIMTYGIVWQVYNWKVFGRK
jgi:hypothetical protein